MAGSDVQLVILFGKNVTASFVRGLAQTRGGFRTISKILNRSRTGMLYSDSNIVSYVWIERHRPISSSPSLHDPTSSLERLADSCSSCGTRMSCDIILILVEVVVYLSVHIPVLPCLYQSNDGIPVESGLLLRYFWDLCAYSTSRSRYS